MTDVDERRRRMTARTMLLAPGGDRQAADSATAVRRAALASTSVLVVGAGGLGSPVVALLAGSGLGRITVVDPDLVDATNLSRQTLFTAADIGTPKATLAAARAKAVDPDLDARGIVDSFAPDMVRGHDIVIDAADSLAVTRLVSDACAPAGIPWVWGTVLGFDGQTTVFCDAREIDFHDLHGSHVLDDGGSCSVVGVLPALCQAIGSVMAAQVLAVVAGIGEPLFGTILSVDASEWAWSRSRVRRGPDSRRPLLVPRIDAVSLAGLLQTDAPDVTLVDVRTEEERSRGVIEGSITPDQLDPDVRDVVVVCERGGRADAWASRNAGPLSGRIRVLDGGMVAWRSLTATPPPATR